MGRQKLTCFLEIYNLFCTIAMSETALRDKDKPALNSLGGVCYLIK